MRSDMGWSKIISSKMAGRVKDEVGIECDDRLKLMLRDHGISSSS